MCDGCDYWHRDYRLDILGRNVEKIAREIKAAELVIGIRESYKATNEGYPQRTAAIRRGMELDRETLATVLQHIEAHEGKNSNRGPRSGVTEKGNRRRGR